jgi:hypothetical protein
MERTVTTSSLLLVALCLIFGPIRLNDDYS